MNTKFDVKAFKRISTNLNKASFYLVPHSTGDYIITENYEEEGKSNIDVNISELLGRKLEEERYIIFRYGKESSKKEESCFHSIKGNDLRRKKSDITLLIFDKHSEEVLLVCGEVKRTLKEKNFAEARQQLISSYIDLNIFNALIAFNHFPVKHCFFIAYLEVKILKSDYASTSTLLVRSEDSDFVPRNLVRREYFNRQIFYSLDDLKYVQKFIEENIEILDIENYMKAELLFVKGSAS